MHLYFPFVTQGIDLVGELGHVLIGHDTLALGNQRQQTSCRSQQPLEDSGDRLRLFLHGNRCSLIGKFIADQVELRATIRCVSPLPILDLQALSSPCTTNTFFGFSSKAWIHSISPSLSAWPLNPASFRICART